MDITSFIVIVIFVISVGLLIHSVMTWGKRMGNPIENDFKSDLKDSLGSFDEEVRKIKELVDAEDRKALEAAEKVKKS